MTFQTFSGLEYLKIDIANNFGLDQEDWDVRIQWFNDNEHNLEGLLKTAEEPALYFAGVCAWRKAMAGEVSGYPISLDATSSGIQFLALLTGDRKAAKLCNVINTGHREDAYTGLYQSMLEKVGENAKITRKDTKQAIMTAFYNSTAMPKRIFGEGAMLDSFYETMETEAPGAWELKETMLAIWDNEALVNEWVMPDNFHVRIKVMGQTTDYVNFLNEPFEVQYSVNQPIEAGRSLGANVIHSLDGMAVREITRRCDYDLLQVQRIKKWLRQGQAGICRANNENNKMVITLAELYKECGYLSARVLNYLTAENIGHIDVDALNSLVLTLPEKPFKVLSVHDCFRVLPNYGNDLRRQYNRILSDIAKSEMLSFMISQIVKRRVGVTKLDELMYIDVLEANYSLS
jgi:hypothetical protein